MHLCWLCPNWSRLITALIISLQSRSLLLSSCCWLGWRDRVLSWQRWSSIQMFCHSISWPLYLSQPCGYYISCGNYHRSECLGVEYAVWLEMFWGRAFSGVVPCLWNTLPGEVHLSTLLLMVRRDLKTFVFISGIGWLRLFPAILKWLAII